MKFCRSKDQNVEVKLSGNAGRPGVTQTSLDLDAQCTHMMFVALPLLAYLCSSLILTVHSAFTRHAPPCRMWSIKTSASARQELYATSQIPTTSLLIVKKRPECLTLLTGPALTWQTNANQAFVAQRSMPSSQMNYMCAPPAPGPQAINVGPQSTSSSLEKSFIASFHFGFPTGTTSLRV